jgi:hypothetical protein
MRALARTLLSLLGKVRGGVFLEYRAPREPLIYRDTECTVARDGILVR